MRETPVNLALNLPRLAYGVSNKALGYCWGPFALATALVATSADLIWALIPISMGMTVHGVLRWAFAKDPRIFEMYGRYSLLSNSYHPHTREELPEPFTRPVKVGRGLRF
ncbi:hypothetical protein LPN04_31500 [Rugamonas sp. A1-17]|nr:hypothetical protein [Rugamonas sp. A1-17]